MRSAGRVLLAALLAGASAMRALGEGAGSELAAGSGFEESFRAVVAPRPLVLEEPALEVAPPPKPPQWVWIGAGAALAIAGSALNAFQEEPHFPFHVTHEGWFGENTYAGGADKASHFVSYYGVARVMNEYNKAFHASSDESALIATGTAFLAGAATEIGDGSNKYGFSWEDLAADTLGAATGLAILHFKLEDLIGFRFGIVPAPEAKVGGLGKDYSAEIYTGDLKIAGLGQRASFNPGPARFLLLSFTYGTKGYPYGDPVVRQRQVGIEIGINFGEVMKALKVPRDKWWGVVLYTFFDIIRIPYTAVGYRYDVNNKKWYGPDTGNSFPNPGY